MSLGVAWRLQTLAWRGEFLLGTWNSALLHIGVGLSVALVASLVLTPLLLGLARQRGWVDRPKANRWHRQPVALMGGVAIAAALALGLGASGSLGALPWPVWAGAGLVFAAGFADDVWSLSPLAKLLVQLAAATAALGAGMTAWAGAPLWVSAPLTVVWVVGVTNAFNLIDGLDGLAGGLAVIGAGGLGAMAWRAGDPGAAAVAATVAAAAAGFLAFNRPPARVFMGDCGSMLLGYVLAVLGMAVHDAQPAATGIVAPALVLAVPLFDTTFVSLTRLGAGRSVFDGGTDHVHHRLALLWASEQKAVVALHGASLGAAALALVASGAGPAWTVAASAVVAAVAGGAGWTLHRATAPHMRRDLFRPMPPGGDGSSLHEAPVPEVQGEDAGRDAGSYDAGD